MTKFKPQESQYSFSKIHVLEKKKHYRINEDLDFEKELQDNSEMVYW